MAKQTSSRPSSTPEKQKPTRQAKAPASSEPSHEQIARRAYELYQTRAYAEGNALHDWLRAERDLRAS